MVAGMPMDRSDLATPTLMRAARGTYARSIRAHLQAIGAEDLPRNGAFILFRLTRPASPATICPPAWA